MVKFSERGPVWPPLILSRRHIIVFDPDHGLRPLRFTHALVDKI
jgi:hypothetical protein